MKDEKIVKNDIAKIWEEGSIAEIKEVAPPVETKLEKEPEKKEVKPVEENTKSVEEKPVEKDKDDLDLKNEHESLKKRFEESRAWGHKKNSAYINAKKKMTEFLAKLEEDGNIEEDDAKEALGFFNISDEEITESKQEEQHPYVTLKQTLDNEFGMFKKYTKAPDADEKYNAYFSFLPLHSKEEQERILTYLSEESPDVALDHIMTTGSELYEDLYKELADKGGILPYVKSLKAKIAKIEKRNKEIEAQLDETKGKVYPRSINSKVSTMEPVKQNITSADTWQNG